MILCFIPGHFKNKTDRENRLFAMILRLCIAAAYFLSEVAAFLYILHIRNNLNLFFGMGESFCAVVGTGFVICFPADVRTGGYYRTGHSSLRVSSPESGGCRRYTGKFVSATVLVVLYYAKRRNSCRYAALRNPRGHEIPPPSGRRGDFAFKILYIRMVYGVELLFLRECRRMTVSETSVNEPYPRVYATTRGDKVFVYLQ